MYVMEYEILAYINNIYIHMSTVMTYLDYLRCAEVRMKFHVKRDIFIKDVGLFSWIFLSFNRDGIPYTLTYLEYLRCAWNL